MNHDKRSYRDFVQSRCQTNPCVTGLAEYLRRGPGAASTIVTLDYPRSGQSAPNPQTVAEADLTKLIDATSTTAGQVLLVENIQPHLISLLGEILDVDPIFFAGHVTTEFQDIEKAPPPPSLALFPSQIAEKAYLHLHYQQVLDLGRADAFKFSSYSLKSDSNVPRNVRRLPRLSGRQLALARACCSILVKKIDCSWICLVLMDPPAKMVLETLASGGRKSYPSTLLHGGFEGFGDHLPDKKSMLNSLLSYFRHQPPGFIVAEPRILSLGYYPIRIGLAEWIVYTHLISRYFKYYEYTLCDIENRLRESDIIDLQRWQRRSMQSRHKLILLSEFIDYWLQQEADKQQWNLVLKDIKHIFSQLEQHSSSLEHMVPMATRLTFIALVFVPLSWVASLFSMADDYSPGHSSFWGKLKRIGAVLRWQVERRRTEVVFA
ncbi:hypothetical protein C8A05DRAFT_44695 [Staphylotrichum tortipilum]|uniref:Uncharacterized protein n=1 Tax=Staphylotrichum tortipilum TaxID=2831512 RepID=A0AAN6MIV9_9PEZI|nr:hypothetical protein C8A05DRAFT_44695 [Staphylotrichum longicolle]